MEQAVLPGIRFEPLSAFVIDRQCRLSQDQALGRLLPIDPIPLGGCGITCQTVVIHLEVITKQRKTEAAASLKRTMAVSPVTTKTPEQWHNMPLKIGSFLDLGDAISMVRRWDRLRAPDLIRLTSDKHQNHDWEVR